MINCLQSIKAKLEHALSEQVNHIELHGGRFDQNELNRLMMSTPCIAIAPLNITTAEDVGDGTSDSKLQMGVYVVTNSQLCDAFIEQINLVEKVLHTLTGEWFENALTPTERISAKNLYTGSLDEIGVAMWLINFELAIRTGEANYDH